MKRVLIISPYFPPSNSADMHRIRMSLPYFEKFGWKAEVVTVDPSYSDVVKDDFLFMSIPKGTIIHSVKALSKQLTTKVGLGSIALRSIWYYKLYVDNLLKKEAFDLIYFSTTQFPVCILGSYWKKKYKVPYVIDMQDPWHSNYYQDKPKKERPAKYWFSYRLNKYLEPIAMNKADGLISVSKAYIKDLKSRYVQLKKIPAEVITFGAFEKDFEFALTQKQSFKSLNIKANQNVNIVYVGRGGHDMYKAISLLFRCVKDGLKNSPQLFSKLKFHFIGTSYAPTGKGIPTVLPIAQEYGISEYVIEETDRVTFYQGISYLLEADALFIAGSDDPQYTASKIYPYILAKKPLLAIFHSESSAYKIIEESKAGQVIAIDKPENTSLLVDRFMSTINTPDIKTDWNYFDQFSAENMTFRQCKLFEKVLINYQS